MKKICAFCGKKIDALDEQEKQEFFMSVGRPRKQGASQNYFDIWKRVYDYCPVCHYSSIDISSISQNAREFMRSDDFAKLCENKIFDLISEFRTNNILLYTVAGYILEKEGNLFESACAFANASDEFYGEIIYWKSEISEDNCMTDEENALDNKFHLFAEKLYEKSINLLKKHIEIYTSDIKAKILYAGLLSGGTKEQKEMSKQLIKNLLTLELSNEQIEMLNFISKTTY